MSVIKTWIFSVCVAAVVGSIVQMLVPSGSMEKVMKVVVGIFFLSCVFVPLVTIIPNIKYDFEIGTAEQVAQISEGMQQIKNEQIIDYANAQISDAIAGLLDRNNINYKKISVDYNITTDSSISINEIEITMQNDYNGQAKQATLLLEKETGIKTFVSVEEEENG